MIYFKKKIKNKSESEEIIMNTNRYDLKQMEVDANSMSREAFKAKYMENFDNCLKAGKDYANLMEIASQLGIKDPQLTANKASKEDIERWHATING
jgi:2-hydroxychromene-2-carboxylate isomerase